MNDMTQPRPNILVIICDDLGVGDLGSAGNEIVRTPHLDRFREEGVHWAAHVSGPLCSPARACLLTGQYHYRARVTDTYCGRSMLDPEIPVLSEILQRAGYRTGCFGKWHLGDNCPYRPEDRGFDEVLVHGSGGIGQPGDAPENAGRKSYFDPVLRHNGHWERFTGFCTDIFAAAASSFIENAKSEPWFAYVAFNAPHTPLDAPPESVEACRSRGAKGDLAALYALVEGIDSAMGHLLDTLDRSGQRDNTLIFFTSDHGPCPSVTNHGMQRFNAGLRGQKGHVYEGGVRVPAFWQWRGHWPGGQTFNTTSHVIDVAPTILDAAGIRGPETDGVSLAAQLTGDPAADSIGSDRTVFLQWHRGDHPIRFRNAAAWGDGMKWLRVCESGPDELYDLSNDPGEIQNLANLRPDVCAILRAAYSAWFDEMGAHGYAPLPIHLGDPREPQVALSRQDWRVEGPDGWSSETMGWWAVHVTVAGKYDFTVQFAGCPPERGTVLLEVGGMSIPMEADPERSEYLFEHIPLTTGPTRVSARFHTRFSAQSPDHIVVKMHESISSVSRPSSGP